MWGNQDTYINVSFDGTSQGQLSMVIYEWKDMQYLGKVTSTVDDSLPQKTYVCTPDAVRGGFCGESDLGKFILDLPEGKLINETSFWSARINLSPGGDDNSTIASGGFWDKPQGNPTHPPDESVSAWRPRGVHSFTQHQNTRQETPPMNPSPNGVYQYQEPIQYLVRGDGYYCVAIVPVTILSPTRQVHIDVPYYPSYKGKVYFQNTFDGKLPATDYAKVKFYFVMGLLYSVLGAAWVLLCFWQRHELLPIHCYLFQLLMFLDNETTLTLAYYVYLNDYGRGITSTVLLFVVAILDAGRNAWSLFMLLFVSLRLVRESLGRTMLKCQLLAGAHFVFGVLYAVGIAELELESTSTPILLIFVVPLAFTFSGFLVWILYSLNATIAELRARKQRYKLTMLQRLYRILPLTAVIIAIFFVVSSLSFSDRLAEDYAAKTWNKRWLLDGWLALLYLVAFSAIAFSWRPTPNNRR